MAFSGLLALLDDVSAIADDVATLTVSASKNTTALVTDDMAVTAEQALGIQRERELPVVLKVALGSLFNKGVILVPAALLLNQFAAWALTPLLMAGGTYLCFEGVEKIVHAITHPKDHVHEHGKPTKPVDPKKFENQRVWGAIRTDLILSAEIIVISLDAVKTSEPPPTLMIMIATLYVISLVMTAGVYGAVALLVKLDDIGEALVLRGGGLAVLGKGIVVGTPWLLKAIGWIGTVAMLLVGGHILLNGIKPAYDWVHHVVHDLHLPWLAEHALTMAIDGGIGLVVGGIVVGIMATGIPGAIWGAMPWVKKEEPAAH